MIGPCRDETPGAHPHQDHGARMGPPIPTPVTPGKFSVYTPAYTPRSAASPPMADILLDVLADMRLVMTPQEIARDAEHNDGGGGIPEWTSAAMTFFLDVTGTLPAIGLCMRQVGTAAVIVLVGGTTDLQRTQVLIEDAGPRP